MRGDWSAGRTPRMKPRTVWAAGWSRKPEGAVRVDTSQGRSNRGDEERTMAIQDVYAVVP